MITICMQSVGIPVTNIISLSVIWYDTYILNEAWFNIRIPYVSVDKNATQIKEKINNYL